MKQIVTTICLFLTTFCWSQNNVVKLKPIRSGIASALSRAPIVPISYERKISDKFSIQLNTFFPINLKIDDIVLNSFPNSYIEVTDINQFLFGFGPELRLYPIKSKKALDSFYLTAYFNYNRSSINGNFYSEFDVFVDDGFLNSGVITFSSDLEMKGATNFYTGGFGIGNQWLINDIISIDVTWIALGLGTANSSFNVAGDLVDFDDINSQAASIGLPEFDSNSPFLIDWGDVESSIEDFEVLGIPSSAFGVIVSSDNNSISFDRNLIFPGGKLLQFTVGFAF